MDIAWPALPAEPAHVRRWCDEARAQLDKAGLPHKAEEHWRRASFGFLAGLSAPGAAIDDADTGFDPIDPQLAGFERLLFVDGRLHTRLDTPDDDALSITRSSAALPRAPHAQCLSNAPLTGDLRVALLNHALGADGAQVLVHRDRRARRTLLLDHRGTREAAGVTAVSHAILLEAGASATLVELHDDERGAARTTLSEVRIVMGPGSRLLHLRLVAPTHASHWVDTLTVEAGRDAQYIQRSLFAPLRAARSTQELRLCGSGAAASVHAGLVASRGADVDLRLLAVHDADATSSEQALHVLGGRGRATVDSEARVPRGRRAIRSRQSLRAVQLDGSCDVALRPRLAILSDDVDCRHGATTSAIPDDQLFFLRSRGLAAADARRLLAAAHLQRLFPDTGDAPPDALVHRHLEAALAAAIPTTSKETAA